MHDRVFRTQEPDDAALKSAASELGLNSEQFESCMSDEEVASAIRKDAEFGKTLGISGTPAFFLGKRQPDGSVTIKQVISGARDLQEFQKAIDKLGG